jgi:phosphate starvation-inducible PhoH-like protein
MTTPQQTHIPHDTPKQKQPRKPRTKPSQKEIYNMFFEETGETLGAATAYSKTRSQANHSHGPKTQPVGYDQTQYFSKNERLAFEKKFTYPKNVKQHEYVALMKNPHRKIVIATGPAGTGKTLFATQYGIYHFMTGQCEKLVFTRPSVSVDEDLGYLPGTLEEKMAPWVRPIYDILYTFWSPKEVQSFVEDKVFEIAPLGYMRGRTFKNTWIIADEMQNSTVSQIKMLMTRLGTNSKIVITGDLEQFDKPDELNGLEDFLSKFRGKRSDSISSFEFDRSDIQREEVVKEVLEIYSTSKIPTNYLHKPASDDEDSEAGSKSISK